MAMAADWSELPSDLLHLISQRIDTEFDLIRFRSVCSNWRSSSIPNHHPNPTLEFPLFKSPFLSDSINNITSFCDLSKRSLFLIKPPPQTLLPPWLIRITQNSHGKIKLLHPFLSYQSPPHAFHFPLALDFNQLSVFHLATDFIVGEPLLCGYMYPEKVVSTVYHGNKPIVLATLFSSPNSVLLKCGEDNWKVIPDVSGCSGDISFFKGRPYVVDKIGRIVTVGSDDSTVQLVAEPLVGGGADIKYLVENEGELLLVDVDELFSFGYPDEDDFGEDVLEINVFRLDEKEKKWVSLTSLGDRVLFLGHGCSFSASGSDLCVAKGNCVIFIDDVFFSSSLQCGSSVFHLDQGRLSPLSDYPEYFKLFWPPPEWIVKCCISN